MQFWRQNSRKVYAIASEDTSGPPHAKKHTGASVNNEDKDIELAKETTLQEIHKRLDALFKINKSVMPLPFGIVNDIQLAFNCIICQDLITPPVMVSTCCHSILGCQECIDIYFSHSDTGHSNDILNKGCPKCRAPRGYSSTQKLLGLDDFLLNIRSIILGGNEPPSATGNHGSM